MSGDIDFGILADFFLDEIERLDIVRVFHCQVHDAFFIYLEEDGIVLSGDALGNLRKNLGWDVAGIDLDEGNFGIQRVRLDQVAFLDEFLVKRQIL